MLPFSFRLQSWSQMGNHRTMWKIPHRSYAAKECIFLPLVGAILSPVVVWIGKIFYLALCSVCLGVKSADRSELAQISSQPSSDFTAYVGDFKVLNTLIPIVSHRVCSKAGGVYASDGMCRKKSQLCCLLSQAFIEHCLLFFRGICWPIQPPVLRTDFWFSQFLLERSRGKCEFICSPVCTTFRPWSANYSRTTAGESEDSRCCASQVLP